MMVMIMLAFLCRDEAARMCFSLKGEMRNCFARCSSGLGGSGFWARAINTVFFSYVVMG